MADNLMEIYSSLFDHFFDIVLVLSDSGKLIYANQAALRTYGYTADEIQQLERALKSSLDFESGSSQKETLKFPYFNDFSQQSLDKHKELIYQERAKIALEGGNFSIWELDLTTSQVDFYNHLECILDYSSGQVGNALKSWLKRIHPEDVRLVKAVYRNHIEVKQDLVAEIRVLNGRDEYRWIRIKGKVSQWSSGGKPEKVIGTTEDISDRKEIERILLEKNIELEKLTIEAQKASESKSIFLANMSHEIRTPLNAMLSVVHLLSKTELDETQSKMVQLLNTASITLKGIVTEVLDIAKAERESVDIVRSRFSIKNMFHTLFAELQLEANAKGLEVGFFFDPKVQWDVIGDPQKVKQILNNLVSNALKYTDQGFVSIKALLVAENEKTCTMTFEIKDSGIGISDQFKAYVFHKFTQENATTDGKITGAGLGLAIAKLYANALEGDIFFESELGKGSSFYFKCPFEKCLEEDAEVESYEEILEDKRTIARDAHEAVVPKVILSIDDSLINQDVIEMIIEQMGHVYLPAYNSHEAFKQLETNEIDLILMDIQLPGLDGYAITRQIRSNEKTSSIPIIAMTAYSQKEDREKCLGAGMAEYIAKPVDVDRLKEIIYTFL